VSAFSWAAAATPAATARAGAFLQFTFSVPALAALTAQWLRHTTAVAPAVDLLRTAGLDPMPPTADGVREQLGQIAAGGQLEPVLVVAGDLDRPPVIADGYDRLSAAYWSDEDTPVAVITAIWAQTYAGSPGAPDASSTSPAPPTPPTSAPAPARYPNERFVAGGTSDWKLTLPTSTDGKVDEVKPPAIDTYSSKYFELAAAGDGVIYRVWHGGDTTRRSSNPRSERRQRWDDDPEGYLDPAEHGAQLYLRKRVNRLTEVRPHVVTFQWHDGRNDVFVLRHEGRNVYVTAGNDTHAYRITDAYELGQIYELEVAIAKGGAVTLRWNGQLLPYRPKQLTAPGYFREGAYLQSNPTTAPSGSSSEYCEVETLDCRLVTT